MFSSFLTELRSSLGQSFVLAVWLPVFFFAGAGLFVYLSGSGSLAVTWHTWSTLAVGNQVILIVSFLGAVTLVAFALHRLDAPITCFFEGYWANWPILSALGSWKHRRYVSYLQTRDKEIEQAGEVAPGHMPTEEQMVRYNLLYEQRNHYFPGKEEIAHVMPTRLGNIYKVSELYPYIRYGIDPVIIWPRLQGVLPDTFLQRLQEVKTAVDFLLLFSLLSIVFALITVPYLLIQHADIRLLLFCLLGLPAGIIAYRCALAPALVYAELIKTAFDLYRRALLKALDLELPLTLAEERRLWEQVSQFLAHNIVQSGAYSFKKPDTEK